MRYFSIGSLRALDGSRVANRQLLDPPPTNRVALEDRWMVRLTLSNTARALDQP